MLQGEETLLILICKPLSYMYPSFAKEAPYSPSFVLDLPANVDARIKHVIDIAFLPGFNNPTLAVLYQSEFTSTGYVFDSRYL
jgi:hypothetical protein